MLWDLGVLRLGNWSSWDGIAFGFRVVGLIAGYRVVKVHVVMNLLMTRSMVLGGHTQADFRLA